MAPMSSIFIVLCLFGSWAVTILAAPGDIVTSQIYNQLFPNRDAFYSYPAFVSATGAFGAFGNTGSQDDQKRELAAFFANCLQYIEEIDPQSHYCDSSSSAPCPPAKRYYGRGPLQLSWNYNYQACGNALGSSTIRSCLQQTLRILSHLHSGFGCKIAITGGEEFGATIRIINGVIECGKGSETDQAQNRINYFQEICGILGVDPGQSLGCA